MLIDKKFRRSFSVNFHKNLKYPLGEMSFYKDWVNNKRGDPYPLISRSEGVCETVLGGRYSVKSEVEGEVKRFVGAFFPYATYQMKVCQLNGRAGFEFNCRGGDGSDYTPENAPKVEILLEKNNDGARVVFSKFTDGNSENGELSLPDGVLADNVQALTVTCRAIAFDIYVFDGTAERLVGVLNTPELVDIRCERNFSVTDALLSVSLPENGAFETDGVSFYMDSGVSQADIRPIKYEDGSPAVENGRVYLTASARYEAGAYQAVLSWNPTSEDFRLEGAIFYDCGDGAWCSDVAASVIYDRTKDKWLIWYCSFSHGHILAHAESYSDIRHGITVLDTVRMESETVLYDGNADSETALGAGGEKYGKSVLSDDRLFFAKSGDEDPDMIYDKESGKWLLIICRHHSESKGYRYFLYESDDPFTGYVFKDMASVGVNTGGSLVRINGEINLVCGSNFDLRARYYRFPVSDLSKYEALSFDYDDGGFRGWGSIIPITVGMRTRYALITFDRHCGSSYNWSYGNIYVFFSSLKEAKSLSETK